MEKVEKAITKQVYYKDKAAYNQALLEALKKCSKARADTPDIRYINAVKAFKGILTTEERRVVETYMYDTKDYLDLVKEAENKACMAKTKGFGVEIYLNSIKSVSWYILRSECKRLLDDGKFPDVNNDGQVDHRDISIYVYEALQERIIDILKTAGWLTFDKDDADSGGGGSGLEDDLK